ncbi:hypothetical protein BBJ28_00019456 [Nothophytophthora sp. Chile5]|nr:hypothetical protein BBJ28_00019456 [Nothophytophthora sp. Chile5]
MARPQLSRERVSQAADEADFRATSADLFLRDEERRARLDQVVLPPQRRDADDDEPDSMSPPKMVRKFLGVLSPFLYETYVECADDSWPMGKLVRSGNTFRNFPYARYATDVTFQQANKPGSNMNEIMRYYSGKHHLYGYKVEVSVLPNGIAINCTDHKGGRESDIELFRGNSAFHTRALQKLPNESTLSDGGQLAEAFPTEWAVLTDKGYQGLANDFRAVHPTKARRLQPLSLAESRRNDDISHDRVVVENFFGRLKTLWGICADKWKWDEGSYDLFFRACVALTNTSIRLRPLRDDDGNLYEKYDARLCEIGTAIMEKETRKRKRYQANREARMRTAYRRRTSLSSSYSYSESDEEETHVGVC